jgi:hypothetical protein
LQKRDAAGLQLQYAVFLIAALTAPDEYQCNFAISPDANIQFENYLAGSHAS